MVEILAGFDPGHLWNRLDLLAETRHTPRDRQAVHYGLLRALGITRCRDGLPWRSGKYGRMAVAAAAGMDVIFDAVHFDPAPTDAEMLEHFEWIGRASRGAPIWVCPMNEPSIVPMLTGGERSRRWADQMALSCMGVVSRWNSNAQFMTVDVINGGSEEQYESTDFLVANGSVAKIGINYYPQHALAPLAEVLVSTWKRYGLPVMVSETGWHVGHEGQAAAHPWCKNRGHWLLYVLSQCKIAEALGVVIDGVCIYPATDTPSWDVPGEVWLNGLIGLDLAIEPTLREVIAADEVMRTELLGRWKREG